MLRAQWHLGWYDWSITPLGRGFDSFYGYFQGDEDYYNHTVGGEIGKTSGYDFWNDSAVDWDASAGTAAPAIEKYSTTLFTERAVQLIHPVLVPLRCWIQLRDHPAEDPGDVGL